jgi:hypothetical protein
MNMIALKRVFAAMSLLVLAACGGGGGSAGTPPFGPDPGTPPVPTPTVANLSLTLSAPSIGNSGSETVTVTAIATNANNQVVEGAEVLLSVEDAEIVVDDAETDANGAVTATVRLGEDRSNRTVTVTAKANDGAITRTRTFQVVGARLTGTPVPAVLTTGSAGEVQFRLVDTNSLPMAEVPITITGPGGTQTDSETGANGDYKYTFTAPSTAGNLTIRAEAGGATLEVTVVVQPTGGGSIPPVDSTAQPIRSASVSANPSVVAVNTATTNNQAQIRVLFLTDLNSAVQNMRVRFDLGGDANSIGGTFTTGTNLVYSDATGVATSAYVPGTRSSPTDGVTVRACWDYADFAVGACPNHVSTTLTVVADPVSVSIGTDNAILTGTSGLTYVKRYVVQVVDSSGVAKPDVRITPSVDLLQYFKGEWLPGWTKAVRATCDNEDINRNNTNEVYSNGGVEDANGSFNLTPGRPALEPRKADVAISFEGAGTTNAQGEVILRLEYPQSVGSWVRFNLQVSASGISATEGRANYEAILPIPANAITDPLVAPPFQFSPYGILPSPVVNVMHPDLIDSNGNPLSGQLCTEPN